MKLSDKYILGDCMDYLPDYPDNHFDLAIVDPPYGIGAGKRRGDTGKNKHIKQRDYKYSNWDNNSPQHEFFKELLRVSKNQIIWGANHFISKIPFDSSCWIVWNKKNGNNLYADCELAWASFNNTVRMFEYRWFGFLQEKAGINKENRIHPTQKPVQLYKWLLKNYAKEGDLILDTHVGSASSLIAFIQEGFDFVGFEIDEDYYRDSTKRIIDVTSQTSLMDFVD